MDPETYYDEKAPYYDGEYKTLHDDIYRDITWDNMVRFLPNSTDSLILDMGGGTGEWAIPLAKKGYSVVLADISRGMLRQARLKCEAEGLENVEFHRVDICDMSCFPDEHFDMVLIQGDPLSYCSDAERAVRESWRVLKKEAFCIASVDNRYRMVIKLISLGRWTELQEFLTKGTAVFQTGFTIRYFSPQELTTLMKDAGFQPVRLVGKPVFLSTLPHKMGSAVLKQEELYEKMLQLELDHCDDPSLLGGAGHLEIVAKKV
ncbi:MAG: methyltransferase domain-containing protein [Candidatus Thorarchaeota archaeon]|jgi:ubiquinone/menaquinone biosynthesis C-methylase UbiE